MDRGAWWATKESDKRVGHNLETKQQQLAGDACGGGVEERGRPECESSGGPSLPV